jgi:hypothetical protein
LELSTTDKVQFRDTGIYINSSVDGQLDIVADTEIQIAATTIDVNGTLAFDSLKGTGATTVTNILDEDNMASDSATAIATQQSIKAYVDSQVGTVDTLSEILANGNTTGANDIDVDSAQKVQFRDADIYLNSSVDGQLDIVADTEIQIAATTVDLNGDLDVSGTALVAGVLTTTAATVFNGGFASNADSTLGTDKKVQFRDAAIYLNSSVDGQLDIVADTEIQIAATTVDLNGNLDVSGTALVTGVLTTTAATVFNGGFASNADSTLGTDKKVQFRDSAIYINSSADGQLDLVADTEIQIAATTIDVNGTLAFDSLKGTGATTVTNILDEDNMASDSATAIATQQSIKAYVDSQVGSFDTLAEVLAQGNTTGGTDLAVSTGDDITFADNSKAIFGAGSDLQIYSDGTTGQVTGNVSVTGRVAANGAAATAGLAVASDGSALNTIQAQDTRALAADVGGAFVFQALQDGAGTLGTTAAIVSGRLNATSGNTQGYLTFLTGQSGGLTEGMRLDASGNVGIGTSSPTVPLTVNNQSDHSDVAIFHAGGGTPDRGLKISTFANTNDNAGVELDAQNATGAFKFSTGGSERLRIDSSGNVGIGVSAPESIVHIKDSGNVSTILQIESAASQYAPIINFDGIVGASADYLLGEINGSWDTHTNVVSAIRFESGADTTNKDDGLISFWTSSSGPTLTERMRIDASGNVGIGTSSPTELLSVGNTSTQYTRMQFYAATNGASTIHFGDGTSGADNYRGYLNYAHDSNSMQFATNATERMRIDASGNLLVGRTNPSFGNTGHVLAPSGFVYHERDGGDSVMYLNRLTSDGDIVRFYKDSITQVGSIGSTGGNLQFMSGSVGVGVGGDNLYPTNGSGNSTDAALDIGDSTARFKDLYLSGGVYLGGTGAANHLEDYEEGLYTVAITCGTSGTITVNSSFDQATYTKVGRLVTVTGLLAISAISSPVGSFSLSLPFTAAALAQRAVDSAGSIILDDTVSANCSDFIANIVENTASITIRLGDATDLQFDSAQQVKAGTNIIFSASYVAA